MRRPVLLLLLATLLLAGGGVASAAWRSTNTGTATARAGSIGVPTDVTLGTPTCPNNGINTTATVPVTWTAVSGAAQYTVESSPLPTFLLPQTRTVTGTSTTVTAGISGSTIHVRVRAAAGEWVGTNSATVSRQVSCR
jgi:hypothetical protein